MDITARAALRHTLQAVALGCALVLAFALRFEFQIPPERVSQVVVVAPLLVFFQVAALAVAGVGRQSWRYTNLRDLVDVVLALSGVAVIMLVLRAVLGGGAELPVGVFGLPYSVVLIDLVLAVIALAGLRAVRRLQSEWTEAQQASQQATHVPVRRVVLIGAGRAGVMTAMELRRRPDLGMEPVAFLDDDPGKRRLRVAGLRVVGTVADIARVKESHDVEHAVVTISGLQSSQLKRIVDTCATVGVTTKIVPGVYEIVGGDVEVSRIRNVDMTDLLGRPTVTLDDEPTRDLIQPACVLVTGAGGSIGSEVVRQVAQLAPRKLVLVDRSEPALWAIDSELRAAHPELDVLPLLGDVTDRPRMSRVLRHTQPDVVIHAAAHKHVPLMEHNPGEAVKNNVGGTRHMVDLAVEHGVNRFVMVSTDKAVNPTSIMGATKRLAERYVQHVARTQGLHAVAVRFGNVLGSTGSVVPIFREQIAAGGPVKVTDERMVRYFMTIPEAAQLILQSMVVSDPGEVLVLDMGEPVKIIDLAKSMIRLSGFEPNRDIDIEITGIRPGEKLFEELSLSEENATRTRHDKIWIGAVANLEWTTVQDDLEALLSQADDLSIEQLHERIRALIPEFVADGSLQSQSASSTESAAALSGIDHDRPVSAAEKPGQDDPVSATAGGSNEAGQ